MPQLYSVKDAIELGFVEEDKDIDYATTTEVYYKPKDCIIVWGAEGEGPNRHTQVEHLLVETTDDGVRHHAFTDTIGDRCEGDQLQVYKKA